MNLEGVRHRKRGRTYDVLFVPIERMEGTKRFRLTWLRLILVVVGAFIFIVAFTMVVLIYTPLALYVRIPNPELEKKYGQEIVEMQRHLKRLADDVLLLRDYNMQLRKAMGTETMRDTIPPSQIAAADVPAMSGETFGAGDASKTGNQGRLMSDAEDHDPAALEFTSVVTSNDGLHAAFPLLPPTEGFVTQNFDPSRRHFGMDYATRRGTSVYAASDGYVLFSGWTYDDGNMLIISHGGGYLTAYKHNQVLLKNAHAFVRRGEIVALVGTSGKRSGGPHLHFEVWKDGVPQDPNEFLLVPAKIQ